MLCIIRIYSAKKNKLQAAMNDAYFVDVFCSSETFRRPNSTVSAIMRDAALLLFLSSP